MMVKYNHREKIKMTLGQFIYTKVLYLNAIKSRWDFKSSVEFQSDTVNYHNIIRVTRAIFVLGGGRTLTLGIQDQYLFWDLFQMLYKTVIRVCRKKRRSSPIHRPGWDFIRKRKRIGRFRIGNRCRRTRRVPATRTPRVPASCCSLTYSRNSRIPKFSGAGGLSKTIDLRLQSVVNDDL